MNEQLPELHELCLKTARYEFKDRLLAIAQYFLGVNYGPWTFGSDVTALNDFNYDLSTLDCVTYAEVVLALAKTDPNTDYSKFVVNFEDLLKHIHYNKGVPNFLNSNHFFCVDWIQNNKYMVEDITQNLPFSIKTAETKIDKPSWFSKHAINAQSTQPAAEWLPKLKVEDSSIPYVETQELLDNYDRLVDAMPEYSIVTIVRPNWNLCEAIGSHLNISHLGFAFKDQKSRTLLFNHATIAKKEVVQQPLNEYMKLHADSPTIKGFGMLAISPGYFNARK